MADLNKPQAKQQYAVLQKTLDLQQAEERTRMRYLEMRIKMYNATSKESWAELDSLAREGRGIATITLARLKGVSELLSQIPTELDDLRKQLKQKPFREQLEAHMKASGKDVSMIDRYLDSKTYKRIEKLPRALIEENHCEQGSYAVAAGFIGYWAGFMAEFNLECQKGNAFSVGENDLSELNAFLSEKNKIFGSYLKSLHKTLSEGSSDDIYQLSTKTLRELEEHFVWLPITAARVFLTLKAATKDKRTDLIGKLAPLDLKLGILARRWAMIAAIMLYSTYVGTLSEGAKELTDMIKNAQKLPFKSKIPYGEKTTIKELVERGWHYNNKLVRVKGIVKNVKVSRAGGIYRTEFTLCNTHKTKSVQVISIYTNLAHHGMIGSGCVSINGVYEMTSKVADYPFIKLNRVTLSQFKKESWLDYMVVAIRPWFDVYPNSHNLVWSIRPEVKGGVIAKESNKTGAGEIIFNKIYLYKGGK